ncbi:MAG: hypothetical protein JWN60_1687 [Acidobacteria bacterium]|nr:hypothetical protein [Acidobacteriota bacterium]
MDSIAKSEKSLLSFLINEPQAEVARRSHKNKQKCRKSQFEDKSPLRLS